MVSNSGNNLSADVLAGIINIEYGVRVMSETQVGSITIKENGGTYLIEGSVLPVFIDEENRLWAREHYEKEDEPCDHPLDDLNSDGVVFELKFIAAEVK